MCTMAMALRVGEECGISDSGAFSCCNQGNSDGVRLPAYCSQGDKAALKAQKKKEAAEAAVAAEKEKQKERNQAQAQLNALMQQVAPIAPLMSCPLH